MKLQNDTTLKQQLNGKKRWQMRWSAKPLICFCLVHEEPAKSSSVQQCYLEHKAMVTEIYTPEAWHPNLGSSTRQPQTDVSPFTRFINLFIYLVILLIYLSLPFSQNSGAMWKSRWRSLLVSMVSVDVKQHYLWSLWTSSNINCGLCGHKAALNMVSVDIKQH